MVPTSASNADVSPLQSCRSQCLMLTIIAAKWDVAKTRCTRVPSCDLWDEDMLLEQRERDRERARAARRPVQAPARDDWIIHDEPPQYQHVRAPPPYIPPVHFNRPAGDLQWMLEPGACLHLLTSLLLNYSSSLSCSGPSGGCACFWSSSDAPTFLKVCASCEH